MENIQIKFRGIDDWNRPVFKCIDPRYKSLYFGDVNKLWDWNENTDVVTNYYKEHVDALEYFGDSFNCEPHGGLDSRIKLEIID